MLKKDFDSELEDLLQGISKMQDLGDSARAENKFANFNNSEHNPNFLAQ